MNENNGERRPSKRREQLCKDMKDVGGYLYKKSYEPKEKIKSGGNPSSLQMSAPSQETIFLGAGPTKSAEGGRKGSGLKT